MQTTNPRPDALHVKVTQVIGSKSKYHPTLDPFDAKVYLEGQQESFMTLHTPQVKADDGVKAIIDQDVKIENAEGFAAFSKAIMLSKEVKLNIIGTTKLKLGGLQKTDVDYDKTTTLKGEPFSVYTYSLSLFANFLSPGMNHLEGFNVTDIKIGNIPDTEYNMKGNAFIPNPSVLTLDMVSRHPVIQYVYLY